MKIEIVVGMIAALIIGMLIGSALHPSDGIRPPVPSKEHFVPETEEAFEYMLEMEFQRGMKFAISAGCSLEYTNCEFEAQQEIIDRAWEWRDREE